MKLFTAASILLAGVAAFPATDVGVEERGLPGFEPKFGLSKTFNAKRQLISTSGKHKFVPPDFKKGDQRGPCPGLNALANHGYLPHSGVATIPQYIEATNKVLGMGIDVSTVFAIYGAFTSGNGFSWSLGGPGKLGPKDPFPDLLGSPKGISFSHNEYEGDGSATRNDFYITGDDYKLNISYFKTLYDILPAKSFAALSSHRNTRVQTSVADNPYFFNGPFTGIAIAGGANSFVWRLAANHSKEFPQGYLSKETFKSFWAVFGEGDNLYWRPGWDRIPDNWYRRPFDDEYSLAFAGEDLVRYAISHPETAKVGGNLGKVNTFTGVDVTNLTGGVYNSKDLLEGNNLACFTFLAGQLLAPDILAKTFKDITGPLAKLNKAFNGALGPLQCRNIQKFDTRALEKYPGYRNPKKHA